MTKVLIYYEKQKFKMLRFSCSFRAPLTNFSYEPVIILLLQCYDKKDVVLDAHYAYFTDLGQIMLFQFTLSN